jgi:hypothetical protein
MQSTAPPAGGQRQFCGKIQETGLEKWQPFMPLNPDLSGKCGQFDGEKHEKGRLPRHLTPI